VLHQRGSNVEQVIARRREKPFSTALGEVADQKEKAQMSSLKMRIHLITNLLFILDKYRRTLPCFLRKVNFAKRAKSEKFK